MQITLTHRDEDVFHNLYKRLEEIDKDASSSSIDFFGGKPVGVGVVYVAIAAKTLIDRIIHLTGASPHSVIEESNTDWPVKNWSQNLHLWALKTPSMVY